MDDDSALARSRSAVLRMAATCFGVMRATLLEIFDEAAYARFLTRRQMAESRASYAAFLAETAAARERRPRCC